jgi:murein DD-endopeptidase MepM/ murein hydrolase activator NlpD
VTTAPAVIAPILPAPTVPVAPAAEPPPPQPLPSPAQVQAPTQEPAQAPAQSVPTAATPAPPPRAGRNFQWPVRGRVIQDFGPQGRGLQNDGLNIAAARGTPFRAAENGVVVYAGDEIKGFGNLLLVRHADGFVTAYAHAESLAVRPGDVVRRGQVIGRVGNSGGVDQPQLHFEVRRGTEPVDPRPLLAQPTG